MSSEASSSLKNMEGRSSASASTNNDDDLECSEDFHRTQSNMSMNTLCLEREEEIHIFDRSDPIPSIDQGFSIETSIRKIPVLPGPDQREDDSQNSKVASRKKIISKKSSTTTESSMGVPEYHKFTLVDDDNTSNLLGSTSTAMSTISMSFSDQQRSSNEKSSFVQQYESDISSISSADEDKISESPQDILLSLGVITKQKYEQFKLLVSRNSNDRPQDSDISEVSSSQSRTTTSASAKKKKYFGKKSSSSILPLSAGSAMAGKKTKNNNVSISGDVYLIHAIFNNFCSPCPSIQQITDILQDAKSNKNTIALEQKLPKDPIISGGEGPTPVVRLLSHNPSKGLLKLPEYFQLTFFRILVRLLGSSRMDLFLHDTSGISSKDEDSKNTTKSMSGKIDTSKPIQRHSFSTVSMSRSFIESNKEYNDEMDESDGSLLRGWDTSEDTSSSDPTFPSVRDARQQKFSKQKTAASEKTNNASFFSKIVKKNSNNGPSGSSNNNKLLPHHLVRRQSLQSLSMRSLGSNDNSTRSMLADEQFLKLQNDLHLCSIIRFRSCNEWKRYAKALSSGPTNNNNNNSTSFLNSVGRGSIVATFNLLRLFVVSSSTSGRSKTQQITTLCTRLIGIICATGMSPRDLRYLFDLIMNNKSMMGDNINDKAGGEANSIKKQLSSVTQSMSSLSSEEHDNTWHTNISDITRLDLIRSLSYAVNAQLTKFSVDKASPQCIFSFGHSSRGVKSDSFYSWPLKNEYGLATWFRIESLAQNLVSKTKPIIFSMRTSSGAGIEVALEVLGETQTSSSSSPASNDSVVAMLVISIYDTSVSEKTRSLSKKQEKNNVHQIRLKGFVLSSRVWYHLGLKHTSPRYKGYFSTARDEVTIFLDGKVMLVEKLQYPKVVGGDNSTNITQTNIEFMKNFNGQAGALYVFKESFSDATLKNLFEVTSGKFQNNFSDNRNDEDLDPKCVKIAHRVNTLTIQKLAPSSLQSDLNASGLATPKVRYQGNGPINGSMSNSIRTLPDKGLDEDPDDFTHHPLSKNNFGSKLLLVWDPSRTYGDRVLEGYSNADGTIDFSDSCTWYMTGAKDVISSIGGMQSILPVFRSFLVEEQRYGNIANTGEIPAMVSTSKKKKKDSGSANTKPNNNTESSPELILPSLILLLAAFLRNHVENAEDFVLCGGVDILEQMLLQNKKLGVSNGDSIKSRAKRFHYLIKKSFESQLVANKLVDALDSLYLSSSHYLPLEYKIFSRLIFNIPLWLGSGSTGLSSAIMHSAFLPLLSLACKKTPHKVCESIDMRDLFVYLNELVNSPGSNTSRTESGNVSKDKMFKRSESSISVALTASEREHAVNVVLGIIANTIVSQPSVSQLSCLLNFIAFNLDDEWEKTSAEGQKSKSTTLNASRRTGSRKERFLATARACSILLFLLQSNSATFYRSLETFLSNSNNIASFILCGMVNSFDETIRSLGIHCLTEFLEVCNHKQINVATHSQIQIDRDRNVKEDNFNLDDLNDSHILNMNSPTTQDKIIGAATTIGKGIKYVGTGLRNIGANAITQNNILTTKVNVSIVYKLLWHLMKCHRNILGNWSHSALVNMLVDDGQAQSQSQRSLSRNSMALDQILVPDTVLQKNGLILNDQWVILPTVPVGIDSSQNLRNTYAIGTILRLQRFLPNEMKERWLFDLLALIRISPQSVKSILSSKDWQPCLFNLLSEIVEDRSKMLDNSGEDISSTDKNYDRNDNESDEKKNESAGDSSQTRARFDLVLKLYSTLLGYSVRSGGVKAFQVVEEAASMQRVCVNGNEVFCILLSHLLAELVENGTVLNIDSLNFPENSNPNERNRALKQSARIVTTAILSSGLEGMDMGSAIQQWKTLRHLTAISVAVVVKSGFGVTELFDYRSQTAASIDSKSGGLYGIRLPDGNISGLLASELTVVSSDSGPSKAYLRIACITLAAQLLSLLDAFIFPDSLDASLPASQLHGLALVRGTEPRLAKTQGPLLASLLRLSLLLIAHLEPSSIKFLQCCSRLRCFLHWTLELIRESVALGGYSAPFQELTAPLDRLVLAVVLQCHRALSKCSAVLAEIDSSPAEKYFSSMDARQKNYKRLFRSISELREIVLAAYRGRNEVLRAGLSLQAYERLQAGLEDIVSKKEYTDGSSQHHKKPKESSLRAFISNSWVNGFHDVIMHNDLHIPEMVSDGQVYRNRTASAHGRVAIQDLCEESNKIVHEYDIALNSPFEEYCENQRLWAQTDAVREMEFEGDLIVKRLSHGHKLDMMEAKRLTSLRSDIATFKRNLVERNISAFWSSYTQQSSSGGSTFWKLCVFPDRLHRRILLTRNLDFNNHEDACYETMIGKDKEKNTFRLSDCESSIVLKRARTGIVHYDPAEDENDIEHEIDAELERVLEEENSNSEAEELSKNDNEENSETDSNADGNGWSHIEMDEVNPMIDSDSITTKQDKFAWVKPLLWSEDEQPVQSFEPVTQVSLQYLTEGILLLTTHGLYFHPTSDSVNVMTKESLDHTGDPSERDQRWRLCSLTEVHGRRYILRAQALEFFFADTKELFISFNGGARVRDLFYSRLRTCKVPMLFSPRSLNPRIVFKRSKITELWRKRKLSNFEYIMQLNIIAGRTFNDITQYPVFPWVLADYTSETLDLSDSRVFRDLSKPVGALNPNRLAQLIERFNDLDGFPEEEKFLYGSHYSSPGVVLHYLLRQEPFTTMAIELQSGRFDCPDRLFYDLAGSWRSCMTSTSDVKELIPEFYTCPEIFLNTNNFPFGETQLRVPVDDVILPPWCNGSAHEFVRLHRQALESEYVSQNLHHWVDLVFGYKQRGPEAASAYNMFHYLSYEGAVDLDKITDEVDRKATESHIQNFGQTPTQLILKESHPIRLAINECWSPLCKEFRLRELRCHTPPKQFGGKGKNEANGGVLSIHVLIDTIIVVYDDLSVGTYKWSASWTGQIPFTFKMDKLRPLESRAISMYRLDKAVQENGMLGNWSFGVTVAGPLAKSHRMGTQRAMGSNPSGNSGNFDASTYLISCGYWDESIKVHSLDMMRVKCSENGGHRGPITCLSIGDDGLLMVTGGQDGTCRVWVIENSNLSTTLSEGIIKSGLGTTEGIDNRILCCCHVLWGHQEAITCIAFCSELDVKVSGSMDGVICVHTVRSGAFIRKICLEENSHDHAAVRKLALDTTGSFVAHYDDGMLHMFTVNGVKLARANAGEKIYAMEICPGGDMLVTGGENCNVVIRSLNDLSVRCVLDLTSHGPIRCITFTPEHFNPAPQYMYIGTEDGKVTIVDKDPLQYGNEEPQESGLPLWQVHDGRTLETEDVSWFGRK